MSKFVEKINFDSLNTAPSQVYGNIRLVPLIREKKYVDLRLKLRNYHEEAQLVNIDKDKLYYAYIPHAFVIEWDQDGLPVSNKGTEITNKDGKVFKTPKHSVRVNNKMFKRESKQQFRFLPFHLAMQGFLDLCFNQPRTHWKEYRGKALAFGLAFREETAFSGYEIPDLEEALRIFEIHENQIGVLLYVNDSLASSFVVSHPDDYKVLHKTLIKDYYSELIFYYGILPNKVAPFEFKLDDKNITSLEALKKAFLEKKEEISTFEKNMMQNLSLSNLISEKVYTFGNYAFHRFTTNLDFNNKELFNINTDSHIGEIITDEENNVCYLKTYHLGVEQTKKAYLLKQLEKYDWNLQDTSKALNLSYNDLILKFLRLGFAYLLKPEVIDAVYKELGIKRKIL